MEDFTLNIGQLFQEKTKYFRSFPEFSGSFPKTATRDLQPSPIIPLPKPQLLKGIDFWTTLKRRRSFRNYQEISLPLSELSALLWATQGLTGVKESPWYRTVPSAGALHPIDTYLVVNRVEGIQAGIYFFQVDEFSLQKRKSGDFSRPIARAALDQEMAMEAALIFVWVAVIERCRQKYRQRAYRYIYLDCGHIAQNLYLAATAMNLGCCAIGAFFDDEVNALLDLDGQEETAIYLATIGKI